jgi:hypothetical protein
MKDAMEAARRRSSRLGEERGNFICHSDRNL